MERPVKFTVFPPMNANSCSDGCAVSCTSCSSCGSNCGFQETRQEHLDDLLFALEEIGYKLGRKFMVEFIDTASALYTIERLNMLLVPNDEPTVDGETYGEFMNVAAPVIAVDDHILFMGEYPSKEELEKAVHEALG
jgi:hypothetical protein